MCLEKCASCGRFIGYDNYVISAPYGGPTDLDEYICLKCWDEWDEARKALHYSVSYIKPIVIRNGEKIRYVPAGVILGPLIQPNMCDMYEKRSHLDSKWYVVGPPWGDGTYIVAGNPDPHLGIFVADCEYANELPGIYEDKWDLATPQELAARIVKDHNQCAHLRQKLELAYERLDEYG